MRGCDTHVGRAQRHQPWFRAPARLRRAVPTRRSAFPGPCAIMCIAGPEKTNGSELCSLPARPGGKCERGARPPFTKRQLESRIPQGFAIPGAQRRGGSLTGPWTTSSLGDETPYGIKAPSADPLVERRGWDSNPRYRCRYTSFPGWPIQPLLHPSGFQRNVECYPATARVDTTAALRATGISHRPIRVVTGDFPLDRRPRER